MNTEDKNKLLDLLAISSHICYDLQKVVYKIESVKEDLGIVMTINLKTKCNQNFTFDYLIAQLKTKNRIISFTDKAAYERYVKTWEAKNSLSPANNPYLAELQRKMGTNYDFSKPLPAMPILSNHQANCISEMCIAGANGQAQVFVGIPENTGKLQQFVNKFVTEEAGV